MDQATNKEIQGSMDNLVLARRTASQGAFPLQYQLLLHDKYLHLLQDGQRMDYSLGHS